MIRIILLLVWALIVVNLLVALPAILVAPLKILGVLLVVAHIAEFFIFKKDITEKNDGPFKSFFMTLVFGAVYIKNL
jgi:uncharacterized protein YhhL (DUF1145 family)